MGLGDAWLGRFEGSPGVSDLIARTPAGVETVERLAPDRLTLIQATPGEMLLSQRETHQLKRTVCRGRLWTRSFGSRPLPEYPGLRLQAGALDKLAGLRDVADEAIHRAVATVRYPPGK